MVFVRSRPPNQISRPQTEVLPTMHSNTKVVCSTQNIWRLLLTNEQNPSHIPNCCSTTLLNRNTQNTTETAETMFRRRSVPANTLQKTKVKLLPDQHGSQNTLAKSSSSAFATFIFRGTNVGNVIIAAHLVVHTHCPPTAQKIMETCFPEF